MVGEGRNTNVLRAVKCGWDFDGFRVCVCGRGGMAASFCCAGIFFRNKWSGRGLPPVLLLRGKEEPLLRFVFFGFSYCPVFFAVVRASRPFDFLSRKVPPCDGYLARHKRL